MPAGGSESALSFGVQCEAAVRPPAGLCWILLDISHAAFNVSPTRYLSEQTLAVMSRASSRGLVPLVDTRVQQTRKV